MSSAHSLYERGQHYSDSDDSSSDENDHYDREDDVVERFRNVHLGSGENPFDQFVDLDKFAHGDILGTGTFGRVTLVQYKKNLKFYALKTLKKMDVIRLKQVEHVNSEKNILLKVDHPYIVKLYCTFQDFKHLYMIFEYVRGGELFTHLRRAGNFPNEWAKFYAAEIVLVLEYLHSLRIIYRDLKPENILLDHQGHIKITDFGFAKEVEDRTWTLCGTPEYLAPEIIQSKGHGKAVDWWALGILIFEMLAGYPPFYDDNPFGIYEKILAGRIQFPPFFESAAKDLLRRLLVADRSRRLGNLKGGADDVKNHKWFYGIDWIALSERKPIGGDGSDQWMSLIPPLCPQFEDENDEGDTTNFEKYPSEEDEEEEDDDDDENSYEDVFKDF